MRKSKQVASTSMVHRVCAMWKETKMSISQWIFRMIQCAPELRLEMNHGTEHTHSQHTMVTNTDQMCGHRAPRRICRLPCSCPSPCVCVCCECLLGINEFVHCTHTATHIRHTSERQLHATILAKLRSHFIAKNEMQTNPFSIDCDHLYWHAVARWCRSSLIINPAKCLSTAKWWRICDMHEHLLKCCLFSMM